MKLVLAVFAVVIVSCLQAQNNVPLRLNAREFRTCDIGYTQGELERR